MLCETWLRKLAPVALLAAAVACDNGAGNEPIIPGPPTDDSGSGGSGGSTGEGAAGGSGAQGGEGGTGGNPMPDPMSDWAMEGPSHDFQPELYVVAPDEIHAVAGDPLEVGDVIAMYDGTSWASMTDGAGGLRPAFHYIPPIDLAPAMYVAVVLEHLELWDGLDWNILTNNALGLHAGLQYVDIDTIYAPVGEQIQMWDGIVGGWVPVTDDVPGPGLMTKAFHWVSDLEIYAMVRDGASAQILMWDGAWQVHTDPMDGLKPEMHVVSPTEIYAVIGSQICKWNGTAWSPYTEELADLQTAFSFVGPNDIFAITGSNQVWRWAP